MAKLTGSVGRNGINHKVDIEWVQILLNNYKIPGVTTLLKVDGKVGEKTYTRIETFQKKVLNTTNPDGLIEPGKRSFKKLVERDRLKNHIIFPFKFKPKKSYKTGIRAFGTKRSNGKRKHAGCDLYGPKGATIRAIKYGKVIRSYAFYLGTRALEVDHGDVVVRYGEISGVASGIKKGSIVKRGQLIAYVGELVFKSGTKMSMLHIELYKGTSKGALTVRGLKPYQRRNDLMNPTPYLNAAKMK